MQNTHINNVLKAYSTVSVAASVIQGSGLGPACYIVAASDLHVSHTGNVIIKFADDTYLIVPVTDSATCQDELDRVYVSGLPTIICSST